MRACYCLYIQAPGNTFGIPFLMVVKNVSLTPNVHVFENSRCIAYGTFSARLMVGGED